MMLRYYQNFVGVIFKVNINIEQVGILFVATPKSIHPVPNSDKLALVQVMIWHLISDKTSLDHNAVPWAHTKGHFWWVIKSDVSATWASFY